MRFGTNLFILNRFWMLFVPRVSIREPVQVTALITNQNENSQVETMIHQNNQNKFLFTSLQSQCRKNQSRALWWDSFKEKRHQRMATKLNWNEMCSLWRKKHLYVWKSIKQQREGGEGLPICTFTLRDLCVRPSVNYSKLKTKVFFWEEKQKHFQCHFVPRSL